MADIRINEVSQNYTYNIGANSFATVALPITAQWGPGYTDPEASGKTVDEMLDEVVWERFPATQAGLEAFVSTYRGPASNYRVAKDYSYHMAMTLLTAGYDVLVCRLSPGQHASYFESFNSVIKGDGSTDANASGQISVIAKYPGTFGNSLRVKLIKKTKPVKGANGEVAQQIYWNIVVYVEDASGIRTAVENLICVLDLDKSDNIPHISELESNFINVSVTGFNDDTLAATFFKNEDSLVIELSDGFDNPFALGSSVSDTLAYALGLAEARFGEGKGADYKAAIQAVANSSPDNATASTIAYMEWLYTHSLGVYDLLKDKLAYSPNRIISPGWDDQNILSINPDAEVKRLSEISPLHIKLMDVGYYSRCGIALLDIPKCLPRTAVYNESTKDTEQGYAQMIGRYTPSNTANDINDTLYQTHFALFAPWGQYTYVGTSKQAPASPSFQALMLQRAMILNQTLQYEWALPTNRKHNVNLGKLDYVVRKKDLDAWQKLDGVGVNVITDIPGLGTTIWGNSTALEVPPATYQALANLSTRYLVNAVEDVAFRCGVSITFQYNNDQAYNKFYAGVTPLLDTMKNVGAIDNYYVKMSADINSLDQVNANTVIGKVYLVINGVINDINIDLIALPPGTDLNQFKS